MSRQIKPWSGIGASQEQTASKTEIRNPWVCLESLTSLQNCAQRSKIWKLRSHRFTGMCGGAGEGGEKSWAMTEGCHWIWFVVTSVTTTEVTWSRTTEEGGHHLLEYQWGNGVQGVGVWAYLVSGRSGSAGWVVVADPGLISRTWARGLSMSVWQVWCWLASTCNLQSVWPSTKYT